MHKGEILPTAALMCAISGLWLGGKGLWGKFSSIEFRATRRRCPFVSFSVGFALSPRAGQEEGDRSEDFVGALAGGAWRLCVFEIKTSAYS